METLQWIAAIAGIANTLLVALGTYFAYSIWNEARQVREAMKGYDEYMRKAGYAPNPDA